MISVMSLAGVIAQPVPKLNSIGVEWMQRGVTATLNFTGEQLGGATEIIVSGDPGVTAKIIPPSSPSAQIETAVPGISTVAPQNNNVLNVQVTIATNALLTDREFRVVTHDGVSNPVNLKVSHLPEVHVGGGHQALENSQPLSLPAAINGTIASAAQTDYLKFSANKGEHVIFNVYAYRTGSKLDSSIAVLDKNGKQLARAEDTVGLDSILDFTTPESGEYIFTIRDYRYQGGGRFQI